MGCFNVLILIQSPLDVEITLIMVAVFKLIPFKVKFLQLVSNTDCHWEWMCLPNDKSIHFSSRIPGI